MIKQQVLALDANKMQNSSCRIILNELDHKMKLHFN